MFEFATYECRAALTRARAKDSTGQRFVQFAELFSLPGCHPFRRQNRPSSWARKREGPASVAVDVVEVLRFGTSRASSVATRRSQARSLDERLHA